MSKSKIIDVLDVASEAIAGILAESENRGLQRENTGGIVTLPQRRGQTMNDKAKTNGNGHNETAEAPAKRELTAKEKTALFDAYEAANSKVEAVKVALEKALDVRSAACKAILDGLGSGPKLWKGKTLYAIKAPKGERYTMRGESQPDAEVIG